MGGAAAPVRARGGAEAERVQPAEHREHSVGVRAAGPPPRPPIHAGPRRSLVAADIRLRAAELVHLGVLLRKAVPPPWRGIPGAARQHVEAETWGLQLPRPG